MLSDFINSKLRKHLGYEPTPGQSQLLLQLSEFIKEPSTDHIFLIKGFAGTGKTTVISALVQTLDELKFTTVLLAPTGRAAKVLTEYSGRMAYTIHKKIYRQKSAKDGFGSFNLDRNLHKSTFFIVDEASMIADKSVDSNIFGSGDLLADLIKYIQSGNNCYLLMVGDTAQLPPVGLTISPALDSRYLATFGLRITEYILSDIIRQAKDSGILENATRIREKINSGKPSGPGIVTGSHPDIFRISGKEVLEEIENCYSKYGENETIVISRSNKRANHFNKGIRNQVLWKDEEISPGDLLMVVKNNYYWLPPENMIDFIANGDIARLEKIYNFESLYGYNFANVRLSLVDYTDYKIEAKIILDTIGSETPSLGTDKQKDLFEQVLLDYSDAKSRKEKVRKTREDPYFNALQVKFAYAVTCHKAQGGQWKAVFIDPGYFTDEMLDIEYLRWLYTAFTRPTEKLYLVNFPDSFFGD